MADEDSLKLHRDLLIASGWGKEIDVVLLLQQGASVRVQDQDGKNCLHYSACKGHVQVTKILLENGCAVNATDKSGQSPLHLASEEGHHDIASILLDHGADVNLQDEDGNAACHFAAMNGHVEVLELLVHVKADLNVRNKDGFTPLLMATDGHHLKVMDFLLSAGVNMAAIDLRGDTALHVAVASKSHKALKMLLSHGADVNVQNHEGDTALHMAADAGYRRMVRTILNSELPVELSPNNVGDTAKDIAIQRGYREIAQMIPDPVRKDKKQQRRRSRNPDSSLSPASPSGTSLRASPVDSLDNAIDCSEVSTSAAAANQSMRPTGPCNPVVVHPSEEMPSMTSSSLSSLWVPTTDSGISLPLDANFDQFHDCSRLSRRGRCRQEGEGTEPKPSGNRGSKKDAYRRSKTSQKPRHSHANGDLKNDVNVLGSRHRHRSRHQHRHQNYGVTTDPTRTNSSPSRVKGRAEGRADGRIDGRADEVIRVPDSSRSRVTHDYMSDDSSQFAGIGCLPQFGKNKANRNRASKEEKKKSKRSLKEKHRYVDDQQALLKMEVESSKQSLEKQMRKMRKKFEKALRITDEKFAEQRRRDEKFHDQLRVELELIEKSLERGSKRNAEEFTEHIRAELNRLTAKLTRGPHESSQSDSSVVGAMAERSRVATRNKRLSAVDLDRHISVSLSAVGPSTSRLAATHGHENASLTSAVPAVALSEEQQAVVQRWYDQRLHQLESQLRMASDIDKLQLENRVRELEQLVKKRRDSSGGAII